MNKFIPCKLLLLDYESTWTYDSEQDTFNLPEPSYNIYFAYIHPTNKPPIYVQIVYTLHVCTETLTPSLHSMYIHTESCDVAIKTIAFLQEN